MVLRRYLCGLWWSLIQGEARQLVVLGGGARLAAQQAWQCSKYVAMCCLCRVCKH
jgi:hypothetical protein